MISLGGGTPVREANRGVIRDLGKVIYLKASSEVLVSRLLRGVEERPMLKGHDLKERTDELLLEREDKYLSLADQVIEIGEDSVDMICGWICDHMENGVL